MTNEVQRFDIAGSPGSGKFTLAFNGSEPTSQIAAHPPAGDVQRALEALSTVGVGNVLVSKDGNWGYVVAYQNELGHADQPLLVADDSMLGGGGTISVSVVTEGADDGAPPIDELPPDTDGGITYTLPTPCSLADLYRALKPLTVMTPGDNHRVPITSTATGIVVTLD